MRQENEQILKQLKEKINHVYMFNIYLNIEVSIDVERLINTKGDTLTEKIENYATEQVEDRTEFVMVPYYDGKPCNRFYDEYREFLNAKALEEHTSKELKELTSGKCEHEAKLEIFKLAYKQVIKNLLNARKQLIQEYIVVKSTERKIDIYSHGEILKRIKGLDSIKELEECY